MPNKKNTPKIVVIGGGTGTFSVLSGLRNYPIDINVVVSMADDGGSAGVLREEFGILPPGDIRRSLVALSSSSDRLLSDLFNYRFEEGGLRGHAFGNIMLTALERMTGSFEEAINEAGRILGVKGNVLPITFDNVRLCAELENGIVVKGEAKIDIPLHDGDLKIKKVWLEPSGTINERVRKAILEADMIVLGPGDLYTNIIPNVLVQGVKDAIEKSRAQKVYIVNLMTKWGETTGFRASDFIRTVENYIGKGTLDFAIINTRKPTVMRMKNYENEKAEFVEQGKLGQRPVPILGDFLRVRGFIRHDSRRLAEIMISLL